MIGPDLVPTLHGVARLHWSTAEQPRSLLILGHGAGGSVTAPDLVAVTAACLSRGVTVVRVEQPYRVAGRRAPAPAAHLDDAFVAAVAAARDAVPGCPLVVGGRSSGGRVAARTLDRTGARGLVALAFPLRTTKGVSRLGELDAVSVPALVVAGGRDPFGVPPARRSRQVVLLPTADHSLRADTAAVAEAVLGWLTRRRWARGSPR